ncbi:MAG TPA: ABC transporter ATP-binding protein [Hyphomicrobiaceae bacterium]|nr:ABC transporter ATP-binding protein [Hyphomicrobiaceae bacterium]
MSITVDALAKTYGSTPIIREISFTVEKGELVSLLGPSGCGKTTTLRCIAGLETADGGSITIDGKPVSDARQGLHVPVHARDVGMVFQSYAIWPHMTVAENVGFPLSIRRAAPAEIAKRVDWALEIVGMRHLRERQPSQLSGGQQQRVALARAIVGEPRVLLFDEPLSNLDAKLRDVTRAEIRRLQRELGVAALYVTHDQTEALSMSDRVLVMDHGRIMQQGLPKDLYRAPENRFVADFIGVASFFDVAPGANPGEWVMPDGTVFRAERGPPAGAERVEGMLRPESIRLAPRSAPGVPAVPAENTLPGRILERNYLGPVTEYLVEACGARLRVHSAEDIVDDDVAVHFLPRDCALVGSTTDSRPDEER